MAESRELRAARRALAEAEASLESAEGLAKLAEGVGLLEDAVAAGTAAEARTARNLAATYAERVYAWVGARMTLSAQVPEPVLEHYFKLVLAFDAFAAALPPAAVEVKVAVVRALIDRYYEGHPPERKRRALEELAAVARQN